MEIGNEVDLVIALKRLAYAAEKCAEHLNDLRHAVDIANDIAMCAPGETPTHSPSKYVGEKKYYFYETDYEHGVNCTDGPKVNG